MIAKVNNNFINQIYKANINLLTKTYLLYYNNCIINDTNIY